MEVFMMFLGGPIFGKVFDNYGPRYLLLAGTFFHVFGLMTTSLSLSLRNITNFSSHKAGAVLLEQVRLSMGL